MPSHPHVLTFRVTALTSLTLGLLALTACGQPDVPAVGEDPLVDSLGTKTLMPLSRVPVPKPTNSLIKDEAAAIRLGKAMFWDMQVGGDGKTACASCHFNAGSDNRLINTINAGPNGLFEEGRYAGMELAKFTTFARTSDDIVGSQGVVFGKYINPKPNDPLSDCEPIASALRQVTGRNTPQVVGAAFYRLQFWDGRASDEFNGLDPFGMTKNSTGNTLGPVMKNSSLASQAVGPANNPVEMACDGRNFNDPVHGLGTKLIDLKPLAKQYVSDKDSVLGGLRDSSGYGLKDTYREMIEDAFGSYYGKYAETHFSRIWGEAVQAYERTLIPDQTPLDRYLAGNRRAMTESQKRGLNVFTGKGSCMDCHAGPELSDATVSFYKERGSINSDGGDQGFHNIGSIPTAWDLGRAALGPNDKPWSESKSYFDRGAMKTPQLRNVGLTAPYMSTGRIGDLRDVVKFYARGGDFKNPELSGRMKELSLDEQDINQLVDFMANALTDCRVKNHYAPFDHPSLWLPNGTSLPATGGGKC